MATISARSLEAKRAIGYLPEQLAFYGDMRVREYLDFVCDLKGVKTGRSKHLSSLCEHVGIAHMTHRLIRNLSRGYRQRLGFAQALVGDPKVVILDEPTTGLDPSQVVEIRKLVRNLGKTSTVIISSHILSEIQAICTRVVVLHQGRVLADDTPENLSRSAQSPQHLVARIQGQPERVPRLRSAASPGSHTSQCWLSESQGPTTTPSTLPDLTSASTYSVPWPELTYTPEHAQRRHLEQVFLRLVTGQVPHPTETA